MLPLIFYCLAGTLSFVGAIWFMVQMIWEENVLMFTAGYLLAFGVIFCFVYWGVELFIMH